MRVSGRRYYSPSQGRFLGRDPIEESGGINLYGFCRNNGVNLWDYLGMAFTISEYNGLYELWDDGGESNNYSLIGSYASIEEAEGVRFQLGLAIANTPNIDFAGIAAAAQSINDALALTRGATTWVNPATVQAGTVTVGTAVVAPNSVTTFYSPDGTPHIVPGNTGTAVQVAFTSTAHGGAVHTIIILTDRATGQQFMTEAAPSGQSVSGGLNRLVSGNSVLVAQPLVPFDSSTVPIVAQQDVGVINQSFSTVATTVRTYNNTVNMGSIPYSGSTFRGYNSNSYGSGLILNLGFNLPPLPSGLNGVGPVGWTQPLPDPGP